VAWRRKREREREKELATEKQQKERMEGGRRDVRMSSLLDCMGLASGGGYLLLLIAEGTSTFTLIGGGLVLLDPWGEEFDSKPAGSDDKMGRKRALAAELLPLTLPAREEFRCHR